jgi:hypothetical protein
MKERDIASYIEGNRATLLSAGACAFQEQGPGAIVVQAQRDTGSGRTSAKYHPLSWFIEDRDPAAEIIQRSRQSDELVVILMFERPSRAIYTYTLRSDRATLELSGSDWED